jgi:Icc-related predicted phosphoesterase
MPEGDVLVIAGDVTPVWDHSKTAQEEFLRGPFTDWLQEQDYKHVVGIAGNHDFILRNTKIGKELPWIYLDDTAALVCGTTFWGSAWTPSFGNWAFMKEDRALTETWDKIAGDTTVLITHGPPRNILDCTFFGENAGSGTLRQKLSYGVYPNLRAHVFGHIHEAYGYEQQGDAWYVNASYVNFDYMPGNEPLAFDV